MGLGPPAWSALRRALSRLLSDPARRDAVQKYLRPIADAELLVPVKIGNFTDFFASVFHATNAGKMFRPDNPLLPNYKYVPVAYHSRPSSVCVSGTPVRRPLGQAKGPAEAAPVYRACRNLDYELELGFYIGTPNPLGEPVPISEAGARIFGFCLLNDWSARDIQAWEYQPLGPFLAKNFATTVSPWVVTAEALARYRVPAFARPAGDPAPLPYLDAPDDRKRGGLASGCNLEIGDLIGTGTCSGPQDDSRGCLLEITARGTQPITLPNGETRGFLEDGDEVMFRAHCGGDTRAARIGFGECRAVIAPARTS
jgi:fumarylacetoacetase